MPGIVPPPSAAPRAAAATTPAKPENIPPVAFEAADVETVDTPEGTVATVLSGGVILRQRKPDDDFLELLADRVVLFTNLKSLRDVSKSEGRSRGRDVFTGAYLEGDVRMRYTPGRGRIRRASSGWRRTGFTTNSGPTGRS